jgi:DNA (cytosine-5)-methyltransferase 1
MLVNAKQQLQLDVNAEIIVDNFAGGGGASTGIELALGRRVTVAINHDPEAIAMHQANHPETEHYCESVWDVDPRTVKPGRPIGLLWLSPDCKHFSKAKGGKPVEKGIRGLAWVALRWVATRQPRVIMLENVKEFLTWGPLKDGKPCPKNKGREFKAFVNALRAHGYHVEWRELRGSDFGAPTIRERLFLVARRDGQPIVWPEPTHGPGLKPYRTAAECIDWSIPCPSIFERSRPLAPATCRRIAKGIMKYVVNAAEPFIVKYYGEKSIGEFRGSSINEPLHTQSTENRFALVAPVITEHAHTTSPRSWSADEPLRTICAQVKGGHHALVTAFLAKHYGGVVGSKLEQPIGTVTSVDHHSLVTSNLIKMRGDNVGQPMDEPLHTISAQGTHFAEVRAFLIKYYGTDQDPRLEEPLHTVTSRDRFGLVTVKGQLHLLVDIGLRMLAPRELFRAQGFPDSYIIEYGIDAEGNRVKLTKTAQVRMVGNSVCPPVAAALVSANVPEMAWRIAA